MLIPREGYEHNPMAVRFVDVLEEAVAEWVRQLRRDRAEAEDAARQRQVPGRGGPGADDLDLDDDGTSGARRAGGWRLAAAGGRLLRLGAALHAWMV